MVFWLAAILASSPLRAAEHWTEELVQRAQNPIDPDVNYLIIQNNWNFGEGPGNDVGDELRIISTIPINLSEHWNLITHPFVPVIDQPEMTVGTGSTFGLGDITLTLFFSPANLGKYKWGVGPILQFPTATDDTLGTGKWGAGPAAAGFFVEGPWTVGAQIYNWWSYAGDDDRPNASRFLFQYDITYRLGHGWFLLSTPIITADWEASSGNQWTVPFGGGVGRLFHIGRLPTIVAFQGFYNVEKPDLAEDWSLRLQFKFLFPK
jgi:hypothetical protein